MTRLALVWLDVLLLLLVPSIVCAQSTATQTMSAHRTENSAPMFIESGRGELNLAIRAWGPNGAAAETFACRTPCRIEVTPGEYEMETEGEGLRGMRRQIRVPPSGLELKVRPGSRAVFGTGLGLIAAGGTFLLTGTAAAGTLIAVGGGDCCLVQVALMYF